MITNFENVTAPLTDDEMKIMEIIKVGLAKRGKSQAIKGEDICSRINKSKEKYGIKKGLTDARLRKITNYLRTNGILPVIATSKGYYCSYDVVEITAQIDSLMERANAIKASADGLRKFI